MTDFERREADWLAPLEALERILAAAPTPLPVRVSLRDALGRVLTEDIVAGATLPPWPNSAMDGYAVRGADLTGAARDRPVALQVVGEVRAGSGERASPAGPGQAVRIMTGAPLPPGADSVVRVEDTDAEAGEAGRVLVRDARDQGRNVRPAGEDMTEGDVVLRAGDVVGPGQIAVLAAAGRGDVTVAARPRVAVLCSGDELRAAGAFDDVARGLAIPDSNGPAIVAALDACGAEPIPLGIARDREDAVRAHLVDALDADALVTVGGASMGEADLFKRVLDTLGFRPGFWRVRLRPGTPFGFGHLPREGRAPLPVFGLPGNPASAFVTFHLFVRPFLLRMAGHQAPHLPFEDARAGEAMAGGGGEARAWRVSLARGDAEGSVATPAGNQASGLVGGLGRADGIVVVPPGGRVASGEPVRVFLLDRGIAAGPHPPFGAEAGA